MRKTLVDDGFGETYEIEEEWTTGDPATQTPAPTSTSTGETLSGTWNTNPLETIVTDPLTGGKKGQKIERFDLIPNAFERALARHYGVGCLKYADRNWERGYRWSLSVGALRRHLASWLGGESVDPETGSNHLIAVAWHAAALFIFELRGIGTDDVRGLDSRANPSS